MSNWIGLDLAADLLDVSESTLRSDIAAGRLRHQDLGRGKRPRWLVSRSHVDEIVAGGGRTDRRALPMNEPDQQAGSQPSIAADLPSLESELLARSLELGRSHQRIAELEGEVARLKLVARNANVAAQVQTESLQQFLMESAPGRG